MITGLKAPGSLQEAAGLMQEVTPLYLDEVVDHEGANAGSPPVGVHQQEGDVGLVVLHVRDHEAKANDHLLVENHHAEVGILQTLGEVNT